MTHPASADEPQRPLLDWRDGSQHWSDQQRPCRYCSYPTHLRDSRGKPAHKVCAEGALQQQAREALDAYHADTL